MRAFLFALAITALLLGAFFLSRESHSESSGAVTANHGDRPPAQSPTSLTRAPQPGSQPAKSAHWPASPNFDSAPPAFSPLLAENPVLARVIMKHTEILNSFLHPVHPTLLDIGVPEDSVKEVTQVLHESVRELKDRRKARNPDFEPLKIGSKLTVRGLTAAEHEQIVRTLEGNLAGWVPSELGSYLAESFARSTRDFTNRWEIEVVRAEDRLIFPSNFTGQSTKAVITDAM